ncbi:MAG TPA: hypothetical protein VNI54_14160 [Thermoanaerobaculia bacterium]|nr:hypothetical protein [Thermoanaerobaculia bacterium]
MAPLDFLPRKLLHPDEETKARMLIPLKVMNCDLAHRRVDLRQATDQEVTQREIVAPATVDHGQRCSGGKPVSEVWRVECRHSHNFHHARAALRLQPAG